VSFRKNISGLVQNLAAAGSQAFVEHQTLALFQGVGYADDFF
jgi:hypothetical protein